MRISLGLTLTLAWILSVASPAHAQPPCQVRLILFVPADVQPPGGYQQRIDQIVDYSDSFLQNGFERWGHEKIVMPFRRTADGHAEVLAVRGEKKASQYSDASVRNEAIQAAVKRYELDDVGRQIWWVMVYVGDPPKKFRVFQGGFDRKIGGWSVCNFNTSPGPIDPSDPLGTEFLAEMNLKAVIHELGHGFQLPHIGPLRGDASGNTLMGPTHMSFRKVTGKREPQVYLSEAAAAMMSTHPAFGGAPDDRRNLPRTEVLNMQYAAAPNKTLIVRGRVQSDKRPVYALVADASNTQPGEYWTKTYVGKVSPDGTFHVTVTEPAPAPGTLRTWFAFENGAQTGNGKLRGKQGGVVKEYEYRQRQWTFE